MKEAASGVLGSFTPSTDKNRTPQSFASCGLVRDRFDESGYRSPKKRGRQNPHGAPKELLGLWRSLGGVLKDALGAGVVNELAAGDQAFGHGHLAPGAQAVGQFSGRC